MASRIEEGAETEKGAAAAAQGIVYVATGRRFVEEALFSARSAKRSMPGLPITLFTDLTAHPDFCPIPFDRVVTLDAAGRSCADKIRPLRDSPYEKTLFLDTDTYCCEPVHDLFEMLDHFDIALAHAPDRYQYDLPDLPNCFTELNSGVIAYRKNEVVLELLARWEETFAEMMEKDPGSYRDQHSLRDVLYRSTARLLILPPEYNFRTICPNFAGRHCSVKIIHGRHAHMERVASRLNASRGVRVFLQNHYRVGYDDWSTYETFVEATMNGIFTRLPVGVQSVLSRLRSRVAGDRSQ